MPRQQKRTSHHKQNRFCMSMVPASRTTAPGGVRACCHTVLSVCQQHTAATSGANAGCITSHTVTSPALYGEAAKATGLHALHTLNGARYTHTTANHDAANNKQCPTTESTQHKLGRHGQASCLELAGLSVPALRTLLHAVLCVRSLHQEHGLPRSCLEVCVQLEVVQVALQASHDPRLLVLTHPLLKEVGLAPAPGQQHSSNPQVSAPHSRASSNAAAYCALQGKPSVAPGSTRPAQQPRAALARPLRLLLPVAGANATHCRLMISIQSKGFAVL